MAPDKGKPRQRGAERGLCSRHLVGHGLAEASPQYVARYFVPCRIGLRLFSADHLDKPNVACCRLHRALPAIPRRQAPVRLQLNSRDQARRLQAHGPSRSRGHPPSHPQWQRLVAAFPLVVEAVNHLKVRSCLIDGEVVCCDNKGWRPSDCYVTAGTSPMPSSTRSTCWSWTARTCGESLSRCARRTLASLLRKSQPGVRLNEHLEHPTGADVFQHACKLGAEGIV